ncbi:MAG: RnfABCDGE type electron transport complex subunit G [Sulfuricellaceae bacterium]|nr:RnfABCDGE type electron transport complex subunit G [Sulfuricellaceae bacterium]
MPEMISESTRHTLKLAIVLAVFSLVGTVLLALTFDATRDNIAASEKKAKLALIGQILPSSLYDNDLLQDTLVLPPQAELGGVESTAYRARKGNEPSAVVLEAIAPDGYSGKIKLLIAIKQNGEISGVRVVAHKETPGLGDYIEAVRSDWIKQFDGASLKQIVLSPSSLPEGERDVGSLREFQSKDWKVKKDGGRFDYMAGATITPRAVIKAVHKALVFYAANREKIWEGT